MSRKDEKEREGVSRSFVMGVIALVFLIIGYQTALLIHNVAVTRVTANRDIPDTVYVFNTPSVLPSGACDDAVAEKIVQRKEASHSVRVEKMREKIPYTKVESFRFNPNTVSVENLCRLGFTTKQAKAIDNYRKKGGRFARKSDFAKSFVVSDSIYRRLEPFIDIPLLDLNLADSAAFDALPGIGGFYASKMVEYRTRLGGYSFKEQLLDIDRFGKERFEALSDLITVSEEYMLPYPLWSLPADSLSLHPYIGEPSAADIVLFRQNTPKEKWTVKELKKAGIIDSDLALLLESCHIEDP
jgi:DNA uptake protein ComE-like DNA-binding protein